MFLIIIILSVVVLLTGILLLPLEVAINTETDTYQVKLSGIFKAWIQIREGFKATMKIFFFRIQLNTIQMKSSTKRKKKRNWPGKIRKIDVKGSLNKVKKYIKIIRLEAAIDTGDYPVNALLIPVAQTLNNSIVHINVNFQNENRLNFLAKTRIFKLIILYISL